MNTVNKNDNLQVEVSQPEQITSTIHEAAMQTNCRAMNKYMTQKSSHTCWMTIANHITISRQTISYAPFWAQ